MENYLQATSQVAQTSLRSVIGRADLDTLLSDRDQINGELKGVIDAPTEDWGIEIERVEVKDITLPEGMKRSMSRQAEAERDRRARIIDADGEFQASTQALAGCGRHGRHPRRPAAAPAPDGDRRRRGEEQHARDAVPRRAAAVLRARHPGRGARPHTRPSRPPRPRPRPSRPHRPPRPYRRRRSCSRRPGRTRRPATSTAARSRTRRTTEQAPNPGSGAAQPETVPPARAGCDHGHIRLRSPWRIDDRSPSGPDECAQEREEALRWPTTARTPRAGRCSAWSTGATCVSPTIRSRRSSARSSARPARTTSARASPGRCSSGTTTSSRPSEGDETGGPRAVRDDPPRPPPRADLDPRDPALGRAGLRALVDGEGR